MSFLTSQDAKIRAFPIPMNMVIDCIETVIQMTGLYLDEDKRAPSQELTDLMRALDLAKAHSDAIDLASFLQAITGTDATTFEYLKGIAAGYMAQAYLEDLPEKKELETELGTSDEDVLIEAIAAHIVSLFP